MTRAKDISKIVTDANLSGTLDVTGTITVGDGHTIGDDGADNLHLESSTGEGIVLRSPEYVSLISGGTPSVLVANNGDISFYEDTGTTPKLFWDASAERLGIGNSSPDVPLEVQMTQNGGAPATSGTTQTYGILRLQGTTFTSALDFGTNGGNYAWIQSTDQADLSTNYSLALNPNGGNVGIGTTSPTVLLDLESTSPTIKFTDSDASGTPECEVSGAGGDLTLRADKDNEKASSIIGFEVDGSERMRIDANGEVTIQGDAKRLIFGASGDSEMAHYADGQFAFKNTDAQGFTFYTGAGPTERFRIDANGHVTMPYQSAFNVVKTTAQNNFGTGTETTITWQVELFDQNADFSSNTFTAPVTGRYLLSTRIRLEDVDTSADYYILKLITSNRNWITIMNPDFTSDGDFHTMELNVLADMDAGDTAYVIINQSGGAAQTDVVGDSSYCYFCGFLAC